MKLKEILEKINSFNTNEETEEFEITEFFDNTGDCFAKLGKLDSNQIELTIKTFFNFLKRQSPDLGENWSFIHLIESIDKPNYKIYDTLLIKANKENPNLTSLILLVRFINPLEGKERKKGVNLLKEISERNDISELVKEEAKDYYNDQLEKE